MRFISWTIALTMLLAGASTAVAANDWRSVGPAPPAVEAAIVADPASRTVYIASLGGGVLKSTDNGASFFAVNHGLDALTITAMAMVPHNPNIVYVSTTLGVFRTFDGGANWYGTEDVSGVVTLVIDPNNTNTVYAGLSPVGGVFKTTDAGDTWIEITEGLGEPAVFSLALDPTNSNILYAGTQGSGAFKSLDAGGHWTPLQVDSTVWSMLVDAANPSIVYAGTNGNGVYKSVDAGASFSRAGSPEVGVILSLAQSGNELYAGTATQGVSTSKDGGKNWVNAGVSTGLGLIVNVDSSGSVYVGTNFDGGFVLRPAKRGHEGHAGEWRRLAWKQLSECNCQNGHALAVDPADGEHIFFSTNDGGLLVTENGGRSWSDGGANGFVARAPRGIAFDPQQPRHVYAGSFTGGGLFTSDDHGRHWHRRLFGSAALYTTGISVDHFDHSVYVATLSGDGIWKSVDFGNSFVRIDQAPGAPPGEYLKLTGRGISVDPHNHQTIYAAASRGATAGIWRSQDAGQSWSQVDPNPVFSVTVDPSDSSIVYAASPAVGVLKSIDGGTTFAVKSAGLPVEVTPSRTGSVQADPRNPLILFVGTEGDGVFKSTDGGETWLPFNLGLSDPNVLGLVLDPGDSDRLFASTTSSVFKSVRARR